MVLVGYRGADSHRHLLPDNRQFVRNFKFVLFNFNKINVTHSETEPNLVIFAGGSDIRSLRLYAF